MRPKGRPGVYLDACVWNGAYNDLEQDHRSSTEVIRRSSAAGLLIVVNPLLELEVLSTGFNQLVSDASSGWVLR